MSQELPVLVDSPHDDFLLQNAVKDLESTAPNSFSACKDPSMQRKLEHPCPGCGAYARIFKDGQSVCAYCGAALSPLPFTHSTGRMEHPTPLRIGMRAMLGGKEFVAVGRIRYEEREEEGEVSLWEEWVLLSQDGEARYLEYDEGKWTLTEGWLGGPERVIDGLATGSTIELEGRTARVFAAGQATVDGLEGEIPWQVTLGEVTRYIDFAADRRIYSAEIAHDGEVEWFRGRRLDDQEVFTLFGLKDLATAQARRDIVQKDRRGFGCLAIVLALIALVGWGAAQRDGRPVARYTARVAQIPEEGLRLGPFALDRIGRVHRLRLSTRLSGASLWVQAVLEDAEGPVLDTDSEFWDESGYDDGPWHEWVLDSSQDFRLQKAGNYAVRLLAEPEVVGADAPVEVTIEEGVLYPVYLGWFGGVGLLLGLGFLLAGAPGIGGKVWEGMGKARR